MPRVLLLFALLAFGTIAHGQPQEPAAGAPAVVPLPAEPAPGAGAAARRAADVTPAAWWEQPEWWLVVALCVVAFVGLGVAIYAARLWKTMSALLDATHESARKELRAYVALDEIFFSEAGDTAAGVHKIRIRNYGQTPAYRLSIWCERASHLSHEGVKPFYEAPLVDGQLLHPVQAYTLSLAAAPLYRIGKPGFFTYGRIVYHDVYDRWWVTKFCFRYEGEDAFVPHGSYNHEDGPFEEEPR